MTVKICITAVVSFRAGTGDPAEKAPNGSKGTLVKLPEPKWGPQRETRQTVREGLNDVWVGGRSAPQPIILRNIKNGISQINGSYGFCQNRFVPR